MDIRHDECLDTCSGSDDEACSDRDADLDGESTLDSSNGDNGELPPRKRGKISRELPPEAIAVFKNWMLSEKNFAHPYPSVQEQAQLLEVTGLNKRQLKNWFTNARRRIWKPLVLQRQKGGQLEGDTPAPFPAADQPEQRAAGPTAPSGNPAPAAPEHTAAPGGGPERMDIHPPMVRSAESVLGGAAGSIVMSLAEFENPTKVHTFEVPAELYLEGTEELTNKNKNVIMDAVAVAANARCLMCTEESVDVQAVPCQHLLHTRCLRKWMQGAGGAGKGQAAGIIASCPICSISITRLVLAVPCVCSQQAVYRGRASSELISQGPAAGAPPALVEKTVNISLS